mmetsp:Transcript_85377/g.133405  ORF Transcript_85377/g.133405 Transcript_85377/m.133405 type:complete len:158 (+) Transcript_85377:36-509(+)
MHRHRPHFNDAWEKLYQKREQELSGQQVADPVATIRKMYDKIVVPKLAKRGAHVPLPTEVDEHNAKKDGKGQSDKNAKQTKDKSSSKKKSEEKKVKKAKKKKKKKKKELKKKQKKKARQKEKTSSSSSSSSSSSESESDDVVEEKKRKIDVSSGSEP